MKAMNSVRKTRKKGGFKSYIDYPPEDYHERPVDVPEESEEEFTDPLLLPDEVVVAKVDHVLKFTSLRTKILGSLFVTNFKLSFVTSSLPVDAKENEVHSKCLHSDFLGLDDVSLTQIDAVFCLQESEGLRKKKLTLATPLPNKIKGLQILLKSFRMVNFGFMPFSRREDIVKVTNTILVHRFPKKLDLFYLTLNTPPPPTDVPDFRDSQDWERELQRTKCPNWRVSLHNESHKFFQSMPPCFVVPQCLTDSDLTTIANHFRGNRPLVWCWGTARGAALVRMAQLAPTITAGASPENQLLKMVHKSHSQKVQPTIFDLDQELPSLKAIQASFLKLKDLHTPDSMSSLSENEKCYLSRWHNSGWLYHVQRCLEVAQSAASALAQRNSSVVLQEFEGRDLSCVVSSLVQVLLDPYARTLRGFHSLVQKEWVALGHPFCTRLGHLKPHSEDVCPLWLVFLDCVQQIGRYYPEALEFTQEYLVALWQGAHCSLHSTFLFDSLRDQALTLATLREETRSPSPHLSPVWSWWFRGEGLRDALLRGSIAHQKRSLERKRNDCQRKRSSVLGGATSNSLPDTPPSPLGPEGRKLVTEEYRLREEESSLARLSHVRAGVREKFVNVLYVEDVLTALTTPQALERLGDPLGRPHADWLRLARLLRVGEGGSQPPARSSSPPDSRGLPPPLEIGNHCRVRPWTECFAFWLADPGGGGPPGAMEPLQTGLEAHWDLVKQVVGLLAQMYPPGPANTAPPNGVSS